MSGAVINQNRRLKFLIEKISVAIIDEMDSILYFRAWRISFLGPNTNIFVFPILTEYEYRIYSKN